MAFAGMAFDQVYNFLSYLIPFFGLLTLIVFIHELGHFQVARWCGVTIETFSIGFGRKIFGFTDRHNTRWQFAWLPLGGFVKFKGDANAASMPGGENHSSDPGDFHNKALWQRAAIVVAGPVANFILAIVIYAAVYTFIGLPNDRAQVESVQPGSAAEQAGIQAGDLVVQIDGKKITNFHQLQEIVHYNTGEALKITVERQGGEVVLTATPHVVEVESGGGNKIKIGRLGVRRVDTGRQNYQRMSPLAAVNAGVQETWKVTTGTLGYLKRMIIGRESTDGLAGPIGILRISGEVAAISFGAFAQLAAVLSISIGLLNLFPIPMLDGGHLLYYVVEAIRGKPLGQNAQILGFKVGMALVLTLMVVATWNDISRLNLF